MPAKSTRFGRLLDWAMLDLAKQQAYLSSFLSCHSDSLDRCAVCQSTCGCLELKWAQQVVVAVVKLLLAGKVQLAASNERQNGASNHKQ